MTWRVQFQSAARLEVLEAFEWYRSESRELGRRFQQDLRFALGRLRDNPAQYQVVSGELRRVLLRKFPFLLLYSIGDRRVIIVRCVHAHGDPHRWRAP